MRETKSVEEGRPLPEYYRNLEQWSIYDGIKDFDNPANFEELHKHVSNPRSRNFIIDFNDNEAWCGFDFEAVAYTTLLNTKRPAELNTRWINIWLPHDQKDLLTALAKHYDFTPRLLAFMCSTPLKHARFSSSSNSKSSSTSFFHRSRHSDSATSGLGAGKTSPDSSILTPSTDAEEQFGMTDWKDVSNPDFANNLNSYVLADEIWHYSSVDWGRRCKYFFSKMTIIPELTSHRYVSWLQYALQHTKRSLLQSKCRYAQRSTTWQTRLELACPLRRQDHHIHL